MPRASRNIRKFLPKVPYVGELPSGVKVTRAVAPEKTKEPVKTRAFFKKHRITDFTAKPMKPLPAAEEVELRKELGLEKAKNIGFYRDNRNLFMVTMGGKHPEGMFTDISFKRMRQNGTPEETYYTQFRCFIDDKEGTVKISTPKTNSKFLTSGAYKKPRPIFSGRGFVSAFVDFMSKREYKEISVTPQDFLVKAYAAAGFKLVHLKDPKSEFSHYVWRKGAKK